MTKEEIEEELRNAVEACETLHGLAQEAYWAFRDGEHYLAWQILQKSHGYGYFDDEYHQKMILDYIRDSKNHD